MQKTCNTFPFKADVETVLKIFQMVPADLQSYEKYF
jgi:hypothetical protein